MRLAFVVNDIETEEAVYTTTRLGVAATNRGHEAWVIGVGELAYDPDEKVKARARRVPPRPLPLMPTRPPTAQAPESGHWLKISQPRTTDSPPPTSTRRQPGFGRTWNE